MEYLKGLKLEPCVTKPGFEVHISSGLSTRSPHYVELALALAGMAQAGLEETIPSSQTTQLLGLILVGKF